MESMEATFFEVIRFALDKRTYPKAITDPKAFYKLAKTHELSGTAYFALTRSVIDEGVLARFKKDFHHYTLADTRFDEAITAMKSAFEDETIDFILLKGAKLKHYYPEPSMRAMGDIDVLIRKGQMAKAHKALKEKGFTLKHQSQQHDSFTHPNGSTLEVHPTLFKNIHSKYAPLFKNEWDHATPMNGHEYTLTPEFETCYLLYHIVKHFHGAGVGYRFFLDLALYWDHHKQDIHPSELMDLLEEGSLKQFFFTTLHLIHHWFKIDPFKTIRETHPIEDFVLKEATDFIGHSGIHSSNPDANPFESQIAASHLKHQSKTRFILGKLFPSSDTMKGMYPYVRKHPFLIPFAWVQRGLGKLFRNRKTTLKKLRNMKVDDQRTDALSKLYEKMGL